MASAIDAAKSAAGLVLTAPGHRRKVVGEHEQQHQTRRHHVGFEREKPDREEHGDLHARERSRAPFASSGPVERF